MSMIYKVDTSSVSLEERDVRLYDALSRPTRYVRRLRLRGARRAKPPALRASVFEMLGAFEGLASYPLPELSLSEDPAPGDENSSLLLAEVRALRADASAPEITDFVRMAGDDLVQPFERARQALLARLGDMEALLVLFGAGTEADAEVGLRAMPPMPEREAGPSVEFDL